MATTYNQIVEETNLDVTSIYKDLMQTATEVGSIYLKAKETITDYVDKGELDQREKASLLAKHITELATNITSQSLQAAVQIAKENRDAKYALTKVREDTRLVTAQVARMEQDAAKTEAEVDAAKTAIKKAQAELYRDYGVRSESLGVDATIAFDDNYGTKVESLKMAKANMYSTYATTFRQNGVVLPSVDANGYLTHGTEANDDGSAYWQTRVAQRQRQGFDDNMRQHVVNSSATMVSMLLGTEDASLVTPAQDALDRWKTAAGYLSITSGLVSGTVVINEPVASLSLASGGTITGSSMMLAGYTVKLMMYRVSGTGPDTIYGPVALVQLNNTWSLAVDSTYLSGIASGAVYTLSVEAYDQTGAVVKDTVSNTISA